MTDISDQSVNNPTPDADDVDAEPDEADEKLSVASLCVTIGYFAVFVALAIWCFVYFLR